MAHAVTAPSEPVSLASSNLKVYMIPAWLDNFVWLIVSPEHGVAAAVDGPDARGALEQCKTLGVQLKAILNTHTHGDHVGINVDLGSNIEHMRVIGSASRADDIPGLNEPVRDGDHFDLFGTEVQVMLTEGHMDGHVSYVIDGALFCGDTLFAGGCGYLFDGPPKKMFESLSRFSSLPDNTLVFCAHEYTQDNLRFAWSIEPDNAALKERIQTAWKRRERGMATVPSTIGLERATNPFMRTHSPQIREALARAFPQQKFEDDVDIFAATRALKDRKDYRNQASEQLPL